MGNLLSLVVTLDLFHFVNNPVQCETKVFQIKNIHEFYHKMNEDSLLTDDVNFFSKKFTLCRSERKSLKQTPSVEELELSKCAQ